MCYMSASHSYQYSMTTPEEPNGIFRCEYEAELLDLKVRYPAGHLHVNAEPVEYAIGEALKNFASLRPRLLARRWRK